MSILHIFNYYFLQWFFLRVYRKIDKETEKQIGWGIMFVYPMSGYNNKPYRKLF